MLFIYLAVYCHQMKLSLAKKKLRSELNRQLLVLVEQQRGTEFGAYVVIYIQYHSQYYTNVFRNKLFGVDRIW